MTLLDPVREWLELGGPVVAILLAMSVVALAVTLLKIYQFARVGTVVPEAVSRAVDAFRDRRIDDATRILRLKRGMAVEIVTWTMGAMRRPDVDAGMARENVTRLAADHLAALRQHFRILEVIAALAPLLGLFGTVLGMIEAFRAMEAAGRQVDPSLLSGGIWEALLTTAVGLAVAIPTVAVLNFLEQRVDNFAHQLDSLISRLFTGDIMAFEAVTVTDHAQPTADVDLKPAALPSI